MVHRRFWLNKALSDLWPIRRSHLPSLIQRVPNFLSLCLNAKRALTAEDVRAQEFIAEFSVRVVLLAQLDKVGHFPINSVQLRRWHCKYLSQCGRALNGANSFSMSGISIL